MTPGSSDKIIPRGSKPEASSRICVPGNRVLTCSIALYRASIRVAAVPDSQIGLPSPWHELVGQFL
ncbi:MAG: hypothetical protein C4323_17775 [Mastigocladus sp. ERB_26_2]